MEETRGKHHFFKWIYGKLPFFFFCFLLTLAILFLNTWISSEKQRLAAEKKAMAKKERPPVNVVVQEVVPGLIRERINLPGVVEPWVDLDLLAEVDGKVVEIKVKEGDYVRKGDVIVRLDSRDYENALHAVQASYELAVLNKKRLEKLRTQHIIAQSDLDDATAKVKSLAAERDIAALRLERCVIAAPIAGVVNRLDAEIGLLLNVADPIAKMLAIDRVKVVVGIPESDVDAVRTLTDFSLTVDALDKKRLKANKYFLSIAPDSMAQLYRLELEVDNRSGKLLPGMFVRVEIVKQQVDNALSIPLYSVISRRDKRFVYVEEDGRAVAREVSLGILEGWRIQAVTGIRAGDRVIVVGHRNVDDGQELNVVRAITDSEEIVR